MLLLGDSLTYGVMSGDSPGAPGFAEVLQRELGDGVVVVNVGCSGASSLDWTTSRGDPRCGPLGEQLPAIYPARARPELPVRVATIILGANDAGGFMEEAPVSPSAYIAAMQEIAQNLRRDGAERVLMMTAPQNYAGRKPVRDRLGAYRRAVLALCAHSEEIECGPDLFVLMRPEHFDDDVHPNAAGHRAMAEFVAPAVRALLPE